MIPAVVAVLALLGAAPWWSARAHADRRLAHLARTQRSGQSAVEPPRARRLGWSRRRGLAPRSAGPVDIGILLGLLAAAVRAGLSLPRALHAVGCAIGGTDGAALERVSAALLLGSSWTAAWAKAPGRLDVVSLALRPAWEHGAAPAQALGVAARQLRADRQSAASQAAARLGVRLVLPLGACFLPAFVLIGVVPLLISLGAGLLP